MLGTLEVVGTDGAVALPAAKQRRLLAALALRAGRPASPDALIEAIWGDSPPPSARKLLQVYVSSLRKALPAEVAIVTGSAGYALRLDADSVDAARFERLLAEGRAALRERNNTLAGALLGRALALWRGPAYAEVADDDFARPEAERLEELRLVAVEERIEAQLRLGRHADVLGELRSVTAANPLRERLHRHLMLALYRSGRQADALEICRALRERLRDELGLDPGAELRDLEGRILRQDPALDVASGEPGTASRVPTPPSSLVGRKRELAELRALTERSDVHLLVLTGPGGTGKTRLALELAHAAERSFAHGAAFVELAPIHDPALVVAAMTRALGVPEVPGQQPLETLIAALTGQELLLVVDNAEHLLAATPLFVELVTRAPRLTLVVTSRRVLHLSGEHVFPVPPLAEVEAVQLFAVRARALDPSFALTADCVDDVREICHRLDGLPLAIELAVARINTLTPRALRQRLVRRLAVLTAGPRDLPARQQTLRDTMSWSVDLLHPPEREALGRLAVFAGAWTLEAAEVVCGTQLDVLTALVDHSLVQTRDDVMERRFTMSEVVREFAGELLESGGESDVLRRRHAMYAIDMAERAERELGGPDQDTWLGRLEAEHDDVRLAQAWLAQAGEAELELRIAAAIGRFRYVRGYLSEGRSALEGALARGEAASPGLRAKACRVASAICVLQGDWARARELCQSGHVLYEFAGDGVGAARSLSNLGAILLGAGEPAAAARTLDEAIESARGLGDRRVLAMALNNRGDVALFSREWDVAVVRFTESLSLLQELRDETNVARSLFNLGAAVLESGREQQASALILDSLDRCVRLDDKEDIAWCLIAIAALCERRGDLESGTTVLGAAGRLLEQIGAELKPYERDLHARTSAALARHLPEPMFTRVYTAGGGLPVADAVRLARSACTASPAAAGPDRSDGAGRRSTSLPAAVAP